MGERSERGKTADPLAKTHASADGGPLPPTAADSPVAIEVSRRPGLEGKTFAHFRIERRLGKGGMGEVYLADDLALDRPVALKVLLPSVTQDRQFRQRFVREARAQARINHPNVCHIYFIGEQDDHLFFAMEYIEGESLQERLGREERIKPGEALELCRQAALGLREANRHGFTHRDVKPSNLMVDHNGVVKVVDFGLVKKVAGSGELDASDANLTVQAGDILGTPLYIAPEQAKAERVDFRADIYSLGATLHHLLAGRPPFTADSTFAIVAKHLAEPRPKLREGKRRGDPVDDLLDRMMAKRPADRFADYESLIAGLEQLSPAHHRPAGFWVRSFALALDALVVLLCILPFSIVFSEESDEVLFPILTALYYIFGHGRWGRTLGKAALDLEVISVAKTGPPGPKRAAVRWLVQFGVTYAAVAALRVLELVKGALEVGDGRAAGHAATLTFEPGDQWLIVSIVLAVLAIVPPLAMGIAAAFDPHKMALWDRVAGTRVRYRRGELGGG